nr:hypothetical protein [uncultured bacterium]
MLFGKSRDSSYSLPVLKHIAEIIVSGDPELFRKLRIVSAEEIVGFLRSQNVSANTPLSQLRTYIKLLGYSAEFISWFDKELTTVMLNFKDYNLPYEYSRLPYVEGELRKKLERDIRKYIKNKRADFSDSDWSVISFDFSKFVEAHSSNYSYDPATNGILKFLINTFGFYMKSRSSFLMDMLNTTGMNTEVEGTDYSRADYQTVEINYFEDLTGFDNLASDIYQASSFLYKHNHKIYYDLFSRV